MFLNNQNFSPSQQIDDLLNRIAEGLQISKSMSDSVDTSYKAVSEWIDADEGYFKESDFEIYPQGSFRIGTTVKPASSSEFDLDFVVHFRNPHWSDVEPMDLLDKLYERLSEHETYKKMISRKNRCIRIEYANQFHMDILPGHQVDNADYNNLYVPDSITENWTHSNPRGYAEWFIQKYLTRNVLLLEKAYSVEELPENQPYEIKQPLQRAVQLIKHFRDLHFAKSPELATSSIVLTTLAGHFYNGAVSEFETIDNILKSLDTQIKMVNGKRLEIINPANPNEKFSDKWNEKPELYTAFIEFIGSFKNSWETMKQEHGIHKKADIMKGLFGDQTTVNALIGQSESFAGARQSGRLGIDRSTGLLTSATSLSSFQKSKPNTFYGENK